MLQFVVLLLCSVSATLLTYEINIRFKQGPVRASALIALIVGGFFYFFPNLLPEFYTKNIPLYVIGGTFIGMVSSAINISYVSLILSPILFAV